MNKIFIATAIASAIAATPVKTEARADRNGLEACARAMTEQLSATHGSPVDYRLDEGPATTGLKSSTGGTWYLDARHPESREVVARIDCRVNSRSQVTSLKRVPLTANDARERAVIE